VSVEFDQILLVPGYRKVAAAISERILSRELREGERLPSETELARQLGVNRSTVREALRELESGGLLERRPGSKLMTVSRPRHRAIAKDVSRALTQFEPPIAEIAARNRKPADLEGITVACQRFADENAETEMAVHHAAEFFRAVGRATHNQVLALAQAPLLDLLEPSLRVMIDKVPQARSRIAAAQRRILEAIAKRDAEAARGWMLRHVRDFRKGYELADIALDCRIC
jgi:GntR family transcriptional repressor for pyruvate dehydrogenase complex